MKFRMILLSALLLLFSCDEKEDPKNQFVVDGVEYPLSWGLYFLDEEYGDDFRDEEYGDSNFFVYLLSSGIQINSEDNLSGSGNFIMFEGVFSSSGILSGTYQAWDISNLEDYVPGIFANLGWYLDCNLPLREPEDHGISDRDDWTSIIGELKITTAGNIYEIEFEGQLWRDHKPPYEKPVSLYYKGPLIEIETHPGI